MFHVSLGIVCSVQVILTFINFSHFLLFSLLSLMYSHQNTSRKLRLFPVFAKQSKIYFWDDFPICITVPLQYILYFVLLFFSFILLLLIKMYTKKYCDFGQNPT